MVAATVSMVLLGHSPLQLLNMIYCLENDSKINIKTVRVHKGKQRQGTLSLNEEGKRLILFNDFFFHIKQVKS